MAAGGEVGSCSVAEVMGTEMFTVTPETAVSSARRLVLENDVHHMLVLDKGTLAGIVCSDDLRFADRDARIEDCMTSPVLCITPDTTLQEAVDIMGANDIDCLPVVTGTFLVGIVTLQGLATANLSPSAIDDEYGDKEDRDSYDESTDAYFEDELALEAEPEAPPPATRASGRCGACMSTYDVAALNTADTLPLCGHCRRTMLANQRC